MRLGDLIEVRKGKKPASVSQKPIRGYRRLIQIDDLRPGASTKYCPPAPDEVTAFEADVLIAWDGANAGTSSFGLVGVIGSTLAALRPTTPTVFTPYLGHFVRANEAHLRSRCKGATVPHIDGRVLESLNIPLPPLPEQRRIADILDKADALRAKRRAALAQLDTLAQSIFLDMFGDPATNPKGWPITKLGELVNVGPQNGLYRPASDYGSGTPILRIDAFYDGVVTGLESLKRVRISSEEIALYGLKQGEIVVNRVNSREYLGKSALIPALPEPTVFESNMMRFGVDARRLHPIYLINLLQTRHVRAHILRASKDAVNQSSINQQDVKSIPVALPPLPEQERFARYVRASQLLADAHRSSGVALDALFASLQAQAFAGEL
jgi:type I restriction enzyme S subunit